MVTSKRKPRSNHSENLRLPSKRRLPQLDLDEELNLHNVGIAQLLILSDLIGGRPDQRQWIMDSIEARWFDVDSFPQFLFRAATDSLKNNPKRVSSVGWITSQVLNYYKEIWNSRPTKRELRGKLIICAQILDFSPTPEQVARAIALRKEWAQREGLL